MIKQTIAKLPYAASTWCGFTFADDKQRLAAIDAVLVYDKVVLQTSNFSDIIDSVDDDLFKQILSNPNHVLAPLLPDTCYPGQPTLQICR